MKNEIAIHINPPPALSRGDMRRFFLEVLEPEMRREKEERCRREEAERAREAMRWGPLVP